MINELKIGRSLPFWVLLLALGCFLTRTAVAEDALFNGRDLEGWKGDPRLWRVEDGVLIGETDGDVRQIEKNSFLTWQGGKLGDFELVMKVRITGNNNSGVQYRSRLVDEDKFVVQGYQMDLHPRQEYNAMLYEEGGRGIVCLRGQSVLINEGGERKVEPLPGEIPEINLSDWNEYRLVAKGAVVTHWINGKLAAQITDHEKDAFAREGVLALQLHAGPPMRAEFKDLMLKPGTPEPVKKEQAEAATPSNDPKVHWIWSQANAGPEEEIFLRRQVEAPEGITKAIITVVCDNEFELLLDGQPIGRSDQWETPSAYDVSKHFAQPGLRTISVQARNDGGPAGFAFHLDMTSASGEKQRVVSDGEWQWSEEGEDDSSWKPVVILSAMGEGPWGNVFKDWIGEISQKVEDVTADYQTLPGFRLERVYQVPKTQGSWVAMTVDGEGRLIASDQYGRLFRVSPAPIGDPNAVTEVKALDLPITGAQGLLWAHDTLYAVTSVEGAGVYRITDSDQDGELDKVEQVKALKGGGEHGPHGLVLSPDGEWIYMVAGNHTMPPQVDKSLVPEVWDEDQLLPRRPDARGHARNIMAPGGWVARFTPDGKHWELVSTGYRNAYGLAFNHRGDLFTYDSDMEWDFGTPWYRPTRICHITSGSEFGWRNGTGKWPAYYEDSLPPVLDIGPGSPTGVVAGNGLKFPARYQHAIYMLDWTYATIYAVHFTPEGATYRAEKEELVAGAGLPMTEAVVGADGALYFAVGGRRIDSAVYRVIYAGEESTAPAANPKPADRKTERLARLRLKLEALHETPDAGALNQIWSALEHQDRFIRYAARVALEHLPPDSWKQRLRKRNAPWQTILGAIALARTGTASDQAIALEALDKIAPAKPDEVQQLNLMRAYGLIFARHGQPDEARRVKMADRFGALYPAKTDDLNRELSRLLVYLNSPDVLAKTLRLMASSTSTDAPDWAELATRNERYGATVSQMIENMPSVQNLFYAYCLRTLDGPWTEGQRRQFFTWLSEAAEKSGGASYQGFIADLRNETLERATPEEREMIESWDLTTEKNPFENLPTVEGPGRAWTVEQALAAAKKGLADRDAANGKRMFQATLCASCHSFAGEGGGAGPDLTTVGARFSIADMVEAIIKPNQEVSDQYRFDLITMKDGSTLTGKTLDERDGALVVATNPFNFTQMREVPKMSIQKSEPSLISPMPPGMINRLNEDELRDLLAYLMGIGESDQNEKKK